MKRKPFALLALVLALGITAYLVQTLWIAGFFKKIQPFALLLESEVISSPPGIEDLDYDPQTGIIYLSSHDRRNRMSNGALYAFHPETQQFINLTEPLGLSEFRPHGIAFAQFNLQKYLFVISHKAQRDVVMKFAIEKDSLYLEQTFTSSDFEYLNDIFALGEEQFIVTNDHTGKLPMAVQDYLRIPSGNVVLYQQGRTLKMAEKISYPNGILFFGEKFYVASTLSNKVLVYEPNTGFGPFEKIGEIKVPHAPDNLMAFDNKIYVAAHPQLLKFAKHRQSAEYYSPSSVFYIENNTAKELYLNDGKRLSGASTALPILNAKNELEIYVGSVFEDKILKLKAQHN